MLNDAGAGNGAATPFRREVEDRFGVLPNFFCTAQAAPGLIEELWGFAKAAYLDSPLPSRFKERLFVHLSRFCEVRYCIVRHVGFLLGNGRPAGDADASPESVDQVIALLERPIPEARGLADALARLAARDDTSPMPEPGSQAEADLFDALTVVFVEPAISERARAATRAAVGDARFELLAAYLAFIRTAHYWTETHPELAYEPDMVAVMEERADLTALLLSPADAERVKAGRDLRRVLAELQETEEALRASEERQRLTIELVPALLWTTDPTGQDIGATDRWKLYTGQSEAALQGYGWLDAVHPDDREATQAAFAHAFATGEPIERQQRIHQAGDGYRWHLVRHVPVRDAGGAITRWFGAAIDIQELRELQDRQQVLVAELQHRTRNLMGVVQAVFEDTLDGSADIRDFADRIRDRFGALARVQSLLSRLDTGDRVTFDALIRDEMRAIGAPLDSGKVALAGPEGVALRSSTVQTFALAIHELATNARKYGALKQPAGRLVIDWRLVPSGLDGRPWLHVDWRESGVAMPPAGAAPLGTGQGRELIEHALPYQLGAVTTFVMAEDGVRCSIAVPVSSRTTTEGTDRDRSPAP